MAKESVFASLQGLPTTLGEGEVYSALKPIHKGVNLPATDNDRQFKSRYDTEFMRVDTEDFTVFVSLEGATGVEHAGINGGVKDRQRTPTTYFQFTVGKTPMYSFYFGSDAPQYNLMADNILVSMVDILPKGDVIIYLSNKENISITKNRFRMDMANEMATEGFMYQKPVSTFPATLAGVAPYNQGTVTAYSTAIKTGPTELIPTIQNMNKNGEGIYMWNADSAKVYLSPQSFTFDSALDKEFLLPPTVDFSKEDKLDTSNKFIRFNCIIENGLRTDNYTGIDSSESGILMSTLQFPGDEALLAPMGTSDEGTETACGLESAEGRVLKSITPVGGGATVSQVRMDFHDGSFCIFPDAENGLFTATDKETGQELQGKVENLIIAEGSWKESYAKEFANRIERNTNQHLSTMVDGKPATSAIAWRTKTTLKVIVPTENGSKLITIPLKEA